MRVSRRGRGRGLLSCIEEGRPERDGGVTMRMRSCNTLLRQRVAPTHTKLIEGEMACRTSEALEPCSPERVQHWHGLKDRVHMVTCGP